MLRRPINKVILQGSTCHHTDQKEIMYPNIPIHCFPKKKELFFSICISPSFCQEKAKERYNKRLVSPPFARLEGNSDFGSDFAETPYGTRTDDDNVEIG